MTKFEVGKKYKHRQVTKHTATCIGLTSRGRPVLEWDHSGVVHSDVSEEYWTEYKEPKRGTVWLNIYPNGEVFQKAWTTKAFADFYAGKSRIACIEVPWVEGQGL